MIGLANWNCGIMYQTHQRPNPPKACLSLHSGGTGSTNLQHSLKKKYAALTGELTEVRIQIEHIQREHSKLPIWKRESQSWKR